MRGSAPGLAMFANKNVNTAPTVAKYQTEPFQPIST